MEKGSSKIVAGMLQLVQMLKSVNMKKNAGQKVLHQRQNVFMRIPFLLVLLVLLKITIFFMLQMEIKNLLDTIFHLL